jgi:hypothetical protein
MGKVAKPQRKKAVVLDKMGRVVLPVTFTGRVPPLDKAKLDEKGLTVLEGELADALPSSAHRLKGGKWVAPNRKLWIVDSRTKRKVGQLDMWDDQEIPDLPDHQEVVDVEPPSKFALYDDEADAWVEPRKCLVVGPDKVVVNIEVVGPNSTPPQGCTYESDQEGVNVGWIMSGPKSARVFTPPSEGDDAGA